MPGRKGIARIRYPLMTWPFSAPTGSPLLPDPDDTSFATAARNTEARRTTGHPCANRGPVIPPCWDYPGRAYRYARPTRFGLPVPLPSSEGTGARTHRQKYGVRGYKFPLLTSENSMLLFNKCLLRVALTAGLVIYHTVVSYAQVTGSNCINYVAPPTPGGPNPAQQIYTYTYELGNNQTFVSWRTKGDVEVFDPQVNGTTYTTKARATGYGRGEVIARVSTGNCGPSEYPLTVNKNFAKLPDSLLTIPPGCIEAKKTYAFTVPPIVSSAEQIGAEIGIDSYTWSGFPTGSIIKRSGDGSAVTVTMPDSLSGSFTVEVQIGECNNGQRMRRTVGIQPTRPDLTLVAGTATCKTDLSAFTLSYTPQVGVNYLWSIPSGWTISPAGANTGRGVSYTQAQLRTSPTQTVTITPTTASIEDVSVTASYASGGGCSATPSLPFRVTRQLTTAANPITVSPASCLTPGSTVTFSVANVPANAALTWTLPGAGWNVTASTATSITATVGTISGDVTASASGCTGGSMKSVVVSPLITTAANPITVSPANCLTPGSTVTFSVANVPANTTLKWTLPGAGWSIIDSTATSITARIGARGGEVKVTAAGCTAGSVKSVVVSLVITTAANPITVSTTGCLFAGNSVTFSVANVPANTTLAWTVPTGWTITSPTSTGTSITATIGAIGGDVKVTASGCTSGSVKSVVVSPQLTTAANPITVSPASCLTPGSTVTFSVANVPANTTLTWTLPGAGWTITSPTSTGTSITATAGTSGGNVTVATTGCTGGSVRSVVVSPVITTQNNPITVSPSGCLTPGSAVTFSLANASPTSIISWTLPAGWNTPGSTGTSITATVGASGGEVKATATGCTSGSVKNVVVSGVGSCPASTYSIRRSSDVPELLFLFNPTAACLPNGNGAANSGITYTWTIGTQTTIVPNRGPRFLSEVVEPEGTPITVRIQNSNTCLDVTVSGSAPSVEMARSGAKKVPASVRGESLSSYPNPTKGELNIDLTLEQGTAQLLVTDLLGRTLLQTTTQQAHTQLDVSKLATGPYLLRAVLPSGKTLSQRIQIQH
jgi:hypothetical protein